MVSNEAEQAVGINPKPTPELIALFQELREGLVSPATQRNYEYTFTVFQTWLDATNKAGEPITRLTLEQFRGAMAKRKPPLSPKTINTYIRHIRALFKWSHEEGFLPSNPASRLKLVPTPQAPPKAVEDVDIMTMLSTALALPDPIESIRAYALIRFFAESGCRLGGAESMTLGTLDLANNRALVIEKGRGGGDGRYVFFSSVTRGAIAGYLAFHPGVKRDGMKLHIVDPTAKVWRGRGGGLSASGIYQILKDVAATVAGRATNPHSFRHRFAVNYLDNGGDIASLSQLMGHSGIEITGDIYARWSVKQLQVKHGQFVKLPGEGQL
jgi:integrase/recombinase XerD